ncbi:MAG: EAL domain-containing protein [Spirochaetales bacterium]|nr:EAL domain-containing protein [Spirochaetales bacterium]
MDDLDNKPESIEELNKEIKRLTELLHSYEKILDSSKFFKSEFRALLEKAGIIVYELDYETNTYSYMSENVETLLGLPSKKLSRPELLDRILEFSFATVSNYENIDEYENAFLTKKIKFFNIDFLFEKEDHTKKWMNDISIPILDKTGKVIKSMGMLIDITLQKELYNDYVMRENLYRNVIELADSIPYQLNYSEEKYDFIGNAITRILNLPSENLNRKALIDLILRVERLSDAPYKTQNDYEMAFKTGITQKYRADIQFKLENGEEKWLNDTSIPIIDKNNKEVIGSLGILQDITWRKKIEEAIFEEKEKALVTLESIGDGVITTDIDGNINYINPIAENISGIANKAGHGKQIDDILKIQYANDVNYLKGILNKVMEEKRIIHMTDMFLIRNRQGHEHEIKISVSPIKNRTKKVIGVILILHDVTESQRMSRILTYQTSHDWTTGLLNHAKFEEKLNEYLEITKNENKNHVLCIIAIDQFKVISETTGKISAEELLKMITNALKSKLRDSDIIARLSEDQFGIILSYCPLHRGEAIINDIISHISHLSFNWEDKQYKVYINAGLSEIHPFIQNTMEIMHNTNIACSVAKKNGVNKLKVFDANDLELESYSKEISILPIVIHAIDNNRFCLFHQMIRPLYSTGEEFTYSEVLIRMYDDQNQIISPAAFIPIAERFNLMPTIDRWVIGKLVSNFSQLSQNGKHHFSVNVSSFSLEDPTFLNFVTDIFSKHKVIPENITFEITETAAIVKFSKVIHFINEIKKIGCTFSLDDFGSGWSSFNYLKALPINYLKIDGSFVKGIVDNNLDLILVKTINNMGHEFGLKTVAEYIENDAILTIAKKLGIDFAQGYAIEKPKLLIE